MSVHTRIFEPEKIFLSNDLVGDQEGDRTVQRQA
jgi:hypothetical protein